VIELLPLLTALVAGFAHALEPDHMAAVTTFVSRRPDPAAALRFGVRWGFGHSAAILVVGGVLVLLDLHLPDGLARGLEFGVGAMLVGLGAWLLWGLLHARAHGHTHAHDHDHGHGHGHTHDHNGATWVGVMHGMAGTAPLVALLPVVLSPSPALALGYLALFGVGTVLSMGLYALLTGYVFRHASRRFPSLASGLRLATALGSALIGVVWMWNA
jgi:hypothetical protein